MNKNKVDGFTIIELLVAIVVIAMLAALVVTAYLGIQTRARDTERQSDVRHIAQALEIYYADNDYYPRYAWSSSVGLNIKSWREANLPGLPEAAFVAPGSGFSLVNTSNIDADQYGYRNGTTDCDDFKCEWYILYWYNEENDEVVPVHSKNGHSS